jgi:hypothetical protein
VVRLQPGEPFPKSRILSNLHVGEILTLELLLKSFGSSAREDRRTYLTSKRSMRTPGYGALVWSIKELGTPLRCLSKKARRHD